MQAQIVTITLITKTKLTPIMANKTPTRQPAYRPRWGDSRALIEERRVVGKFLIRFFSIAIRMGSQFCHSSRCQLVWLHCIRGCMSPALPSKAKRPLRLLVRSCIRWTCGNALGGSSQKWYFWTPSTHFCCCVQSNIRMKTRMVRGG